ncbi:MAG: extracellular solute-binding protein [Alphaproteobacteria bacterium]|nr:extracellular solute-binding protein [Alphaproteobacteria bacterium]
MRFILILLCCLLYAQPASATEPAHALAMHGQPKYVQDFTAFDYVNPDAPKGGAVTLSARGTYDNVKPFILKGLTAPGVTLTFDTLMTESYDEPFTEYGLIAKSVEMPEDRSFVIFNLRKEARWHDGKPLTADDVVWSFNTLMKDGHPFYRAYYGHVKEAVIENPHRVKFVFDMADNGELPLIMGQLPVLPKHALDGKDFSSTTLTPVLGSGPYRIKDVDAGKRIVYERVKDYWGKDLAINRGRYNFDAIIYDMYRDDSVLLEAFFAGAYDVRQENIAKAWHTQYDAPPVKRGDIQKAQIPHKIPTGMQGFAFNTRRPMFADRRVREAINQAFDFEWSNRQFAHGSYTRNDSYFENSDLAATGLPKACELALLEPWRDQVPEEVFTTAYQPPQTDGSGRGVRKNLAYAKKLLDEAGWRVGQSGLLEKDGQVFRFEFLIYNDSFARWINPVIANLKKLGIEAKLRIVDVAQYQNRMDAFDFDMTIEVFPQSQSPGNEQYDFWGSAKADTKGSRNVIGIKSPAVDALIKAIIGAKSREDLACATAALDRVLLWNWYVIPNWHTSFHRVAWWDKFGKPESPAPFNLGYVDTWWYDAQKAAKFAGQQEPAK